jgi:hypothetical protein
LVLAAGTGAHRLGAPQDPRQARLGDDFADPGPVQPAALAQQDGTDLIDGMTLGTQF